ncbi:MAG TPA: efflux RND transporter periplasmic adaptor subunit [Geomonas sp.]|nr:efflux RND transporter periplasmic adaptor subunit [Geomonas sp.]
MSVKKIASNNQQPAGPASAQRRLISVPGCSRAACGAAALTLLLAACSPGVDQAKQDKPKETPAVAVARVTVQDLADDVSLTADLTPFQEVDVMAKVAGYVRAIHVDIGDHVRKGQVLAELEVPELAEDLARAQAALKRTEAEANRAKSELQRAQSTLGIAKLSYSRLSTVAAQRPGLVAQQELDDARSKELAAEAQVAAAQSGLDAAREEIRVNQASLDRIRTTIGYARVTAPFDGVVTKRYANTGSMIQAGTASQTQALPLVRLSQNSLLRLMVPVPESDVPTVHEGQQVEVQVPTVQSSFSGRVARFADQVAASTRTMETEIDVSNPSGLLVPGMYAEVRLKRGERKGALTVPVGAVDLEAKEGQGGGSGQSGSARTGKVMVIGRDSRVQSREVTLGMQTATRVEVVSGLAAGDLVVTSGRSSLTAGELVTPRVAELGSTRS